VLGLLTQPVALLLALEMLVAYFQFHFPQGGMPIENRGELPLLFMLVWLFLAGNGAGPASLDARRRR
jgi:putative oxidoreductase